ncbi:minor extracellular protease vpr protein [Ceratobasidium sp. AG-Ba]|nr:minor extracellular protease vpr protein [Ceratobasidium sp. AG-Ba]QRW07896.1 minor extracellular protease vpr protein [Ceratobasidium sp. AG-Ba]
MNIVASSIGHLSVSSSRRPSCKPIISASYTSCSSSEPSPSKVVVSPGSSAQVVVSFKPPVGVDPQAFPVYSGFIQAKGDDGSTLHSSYLGLAASLKDMKVIDNTDSYFDIKLPFITDKDGDPINATTTYSMKGNDTPTLLYRLVAGSPLLRMDLIDSSLNIADLPRHNLESKGTHVERSLLEISQVPTLGILYSKRYVSRNSFSPTAGSNGYNQFTISSFENGTGIPNGSYRVMLRAAKIATDLTKDDNYEVWASPEIVVNRV